MTPNNLIAIGQLGRAHGLKGEIKATIEDKYEDDFLEAEAVFVDIRGKAIPHFIQSARGGGALIVKFEDVDDVEGAKLLQGAKILMSTDHFKHAAPSEAEKWVGLYTQFEGFTIYDVHTGLVGVIGEVTEMPGQWMAIINTEQAELLIPLHPGLIESIDESRKILHMNLPEGLLDLSVGGAD